ncbi:MAG: hypothetical protein HN509_11380 [Halobacteriovoraceae bacterium]|jgi:hypothetical protein|nr:hypothetical protein [Halobacteriovoraceae bacterium]MBT5093146.1 hypothetical protein [Halobacteriovoraceae bacterium]
MKNLILVCALILSTSSAFAGTFYGEATVDIYDGQGTFMDREQVKYTGETFKRRSRLISALNFETYGPTLIKLKRSRGNIIFRGQKFGARTAVYKNHLFMGVYKKVRIMPACYNGGGQTRPVEVDPRKNSLSNADLSNSDASILPIDCPDTPTVSKQLVAILVFKNFDGTADVDPTVLNDEKISDVLLNY